MTSMLNSLLCGIFLLLQFGFTSSFLFPNAGLVVPCNNNYNVVCWAEKPTWLDDAMEGFNVKEDATNRVVSLVPGISGFSVDPELGFCAILADRDRERWIPVVVSSIDKDRVKSPEALTCVQLAGGLDLGTAILPPDALAQLVTDEIFEDGEEERDIQDLRARISLSQITALPNANQGASKQQENVKPEVSSTPERDEAIQETLPKVLQAVQSLPDFALKQVTKDQVENAMQRFANAQGMVDRNAFSEILKFLRTPPSAKPSVKFELGVNVVSGDSITEVPVETTNVMTALGLAMRYKIVVEISDECNTLFQSGGAAGVVKQYPPFRPMSELCEDAKIMDGFVPSMFQTANLDNEMKQ